MVLLLIYIGVRDSLRMENEQHIHWVWKKAMERVSKDGLYLDEFCIAVAVADVFFSVITCSVKIE